MSVNVEIKIGRVLPELVLRHARESFCER